MPTYTQTLGGSTPGKTIAHSGTCDACDSTNNGIINDASIRGRWAWLCPDCFRAYNCKLGIGRGQRYVVGPVQLLSKS